MRAIFTDPGFKIAMIRLALKLLECWLMAKEKRRTINRSAIANKQ
jgi:hypothetical protein